MNRLIVVGSPRTNGRSAALADLLFESCIEECPDDEVALVPVSTLAIGGCEGCDACKGLAETHGDSNCQSDGEEEARRCVIEDDMEEVYRLFDAADEVTVVSPVYFAGPPSQFKALLDRLQPYFWTNARQKAKRPAVLHVIGEGGDPHGFEPLVGTVRSALAVAGFHLETVLDWVGRIDESGEIVAEADVYDLATLPGWTADADVEAPDDARAASDESSHQQPRRALKLNDNQALPKQSGERVSQESARPAKPHGQQKSSKGQGSRGSSKSQGARETSKSQGSQGSRGASKPQDSHGSQKSRNQRKGQQRKSRG